MKGNRTTRRATVRYQAVQIVFGLLLAGIAVAANADILDNWHWRNPSPFANSLRSACFGAGKFVGVGDGGIIHTSPDGITWDDGRRPVTSALRKVIFANGQFVAVGHDGVIATSSDGYSWTPQSSGTTNALYSVAYGNGKYIACGTGGQLMISTNGAVWVPSTIGPIDLTWITFGNGVFVLPSPNVSAGQMAVRVSADGQAWTTQSFPVGSAVNYPSVLYEAVFANGLFVASANVEYRNGVNTYDQRLRFFASTNANSWSAGAFSDQDFPTAYVTHRFLTFAAGYYNEFIVNFISYTPDGTTISIATAPAYDSTSLTYTNGGYLLTALDGKFWTSSTLASWTPEYGGIRTNINRVIRGGDRYLAVGSGPILSSFDGVNFAVLPGSPSLAYSDIAFDGSNYVAVAAAGSLYTSTDGINWTQRTSNTTDDLLAITRGSARWVAVGRNGSVITSPNTLAWTLRTSATGNTLRGVAFGNGIYAAVGEGGTIITSPDGITWDAQFFDTTSSLDGIGFLNGEFVAVGANATIVTSADGASWLPQTAPGVRTLRSVAFGDGRFVACGFDHVYLNLPDPMAPGNGYPSTLNVLLQSTNGTHWEDITTKIPAYVGLNSIAFLGGSFFVCGENGAILQSDSTDHLPRIEGTMLPANAGFQIKIDLNVPPAYRIQASSNLAANSWQDLTSITNPVPPFVWTDSNALAFPTRLYRIVAP